MAFSIQSLTIFSQGHSKRPRDDKKSRGFGRSRPTAEEKGGRKPQVKKAVFESTKKKEIGVSDLTLLSKVSNEAINDNLKKRFEHGEIYVRRWFYLCDSCGLGLIVYIIDIHRPCIGFSQSFSGL